MLSCPDGGSYSFLGAYRVLGQLLGLLRGEHNMEGSLKVSECSSHMLCIQKNMGFVACGSPSGRMNVRG